MARMTREKERQQRPPDRGERAQRLEIADPAAVAVGPQALNLGNALIRKQDVAQLAAESLAPLDDLPVDDDAAAEARADDR